MTFDLVWSSFAVKGFWALWDNITVAMLMRLQEAFNLYVLPCGNSALKQKTPLIRDLLRTCACI
jgi:hypothetical protein